MQTQIIYCGDNLKQLRQLPDDCIDLIYIDPPFGVSGDFGISSSAVRAQRSEQQSSNQIRKYLNWIRPRIRELHRVLRLTGSFYIHCDSNSGAYLKIMLDRVFGEQRFLSHIIWRRDAAKGFDFRTYPNSHESILFYAKSGEYVFNRPFIPASDSKASETYKFIDETGRRYRLVDLTSPRPNPKFAYEFLGVKRAWKWSKERMEQAYKQGLIVQTRPSAVPALKQYLDEQEGTPTDNVWLDIPPIRTEERQGYISQEPLALLDRIIKVSSNEGDIVLDAFCGSGTSLHSAQNLGRRWIGIDISPVACRVTAERLEKYCRIREGVDFFVEDLPKRLDEVRKYTPVEFESWVGLALNLALRFKGTITAKARNIEKELPLQIYPISLSSDKGFDFLIGDDNKWIPVEVKQKSDISEADIVAFRTALRRHGCNKGLFVSFAFSKEAMAIIERLRKEEGLDIVPVTVSEILMSERPLD